MEMLESAIYLFWFHFFLPTSLCPRGAEHLDIAGIKPWSSYTASSKSIHSSRTCFQMLEFIFILGQLIMAEVDSNEVSAVSRNLKKCAIR